MKTDTRNELLDDVEAPMKKHGIKAVLDALVALCEYRALETSTEWNKAVGPQSRNWRELARDIRAVEQRIKG